MIVGAGIGGSVLALALARSGRTVAVLEREETPPRITRPEALQESTLVALERLGADVRGASLPIRHVELSRGVRPLVRFDEADFAAARARPRSTNPSRTRALVVEAGMHTGRVALLRGATVTDVTASARGASVRGRREGAAFDVRGKLVVGDDGVHSIVRERLGIAIKLRRFPVDFVTLTAPRPDLLAPDTLRGWLEPLGLGGQLPTALFAPLPNERVAAALTVSPRAWSALARDPDAFWRALNHLTPIGRRPDGTTSSESLAPWLRAHLAFPDDVGHISRPYGHAERYVADGAALLGDALHPMSPAGAQGANAAIWDAMVLAEVVESALRRGDVRAERLAAYERRRRPANLRSLRFTRQAATLFRLGALPGSAGILTALLGWTERRPRAKRRLLRRVATAFLEAA